ncbi:MAG: hypothetical protein F6K61_20360 [Sphaerospermopsis sp. SIO1G1]|nr:hypothetical protein [Sphaerospermopsis sp. SIO1G1]
MGFKVKQIESLAASQTANNTKFVIEIISNSQEKLWQTTIINSYQDVYFHNSLYELIEFLTQENQ